MISDGKHPVSKPFSRKSDERKSQIQNPEISNWTVRVHSSPILNFGILDLRFPVRPIFDSERFQDGEGITGAL
jgi:hypothetical protein